MKSVVYLEPQCSDKEHASFNAGVINRFAAGMDNVHIFADQSHLAALEGLLKVPSEVSPIPKFPGGLVSRVIHFLKTFMIISTKNEGGDLVVLSMSTLQLLMAPIYTLIFERVTILHHSLTENLYAENPLIRIIYNLLFRYLGAAKKIQNIFLGDHVKVNLEKIGITSKNFQFIRVPFETILEPLPRINNSQNVCKVITFGKQAFEKGFRDTLWLWENLNSRGIDCQIVGFANRAVIDFLKVENSSLNLSDKMCSHEEITSKIRNADIVFFTYPANLYRVSSSGAYFDAVAYGAKIVAYHDNHFFAHEKNLYPNLILCRDKQEMLDLIIMESDNFIKATPKLSIND